MDINAYLQRIHLSRQELPDILNSPLETLQTLHKAHLFAVPFENLSIYYKEPILLQEEALFNKIVQCARGGFCYELNGLFAWLLRQLGFQVTLLSAGVVTDVGDFGPEFDHLTLFVQVNGTSTTWLADVGFGASFLLPLRFEPEVEQEDEGRLYRLHCEHNQPKPDYWFLQQLSASKWASLYRFTLQPHALIDYTEMCHFHQTSPMSHFTQKRICSLATSQGRISLSDLRLITIVDGKREEYMVGSEKEYKLVLAERFGVVL